MDPKPYLEYLDKEMSLMGILSTFSVLATAAVADRILTASPGSVAYAIRSTGRTQLFVAGVCLLLATFMFYLQRSHLAWLYGQICLAQSRDQSVGDLLELADSWPSWLRYRNAFLTLVFGFLQLGLAVATQVESARLDLWGSVVPAAALLAFALLRWRAYACHPLSERPMMEFLRSIVSAGSGRGRRARIRLK